MTQSGWDSTSNLLGRGRAVSEDDFRRMKDAVSKVRHIFRVYKVRLGL